MKAINATGYRKMIMRDCHTIEECFQFYKREGVKVIEWEYTQGGYHHFKEYYAEEK